MMLRKLSLAATLCVALCANVPAQDLHGDRMPVPARPAADTALESYGGVLEPLSVRDSRTGATVTYFSLRQSDGTRLAVDGLGADARPGALVRVEGRRSGDTVFVERSQQLVAPDAGYRVTLPANARRVTGTLEFLHADDFERDGYEIRYTLKAEDGAHVEVRFPVVPDILERGMTLAVDAVPAGDSLEARAVEIVEDAPAKRAGVEAKVTGTTKVLVILIKYANTTTEPYTQAQIQGTVFANASSVANYFREASYGKHTLTGVVTPWLTARFDRPSSCDYSKVASEATYLAQQAGYATSNYQKFVYVFPSLPNCGWSGLGGGSQAWINQAASVLVIGHELGHTFGLGHASSLDCGAKVLGGTCTRSEYGDGFAIMGNSRAGHFNAIHKLQAGYFGTNEVRTHLGGTATYTLAPYETPGGATYAVRIPASAKRYYWLEWRQPVGFDANVPSAAFNGALVHIGYPNDYSCGSCLLDTTPGTSTFGDSALAVGQTWNDEATGTELSVVSKSATALTVTVTTPPRVQFVDVPSTHSAYAAIEALVWNGVTLGCSSAPARFCPDEPVTREAMAVFIERAKRGADFARTVTGSRFADVPASHWSAGFIEQLYDDGITSGCAASPLRFCPDVPITREQMAPMLLKARYGGSFNPGSATGKTFGDVPKSHPFAAWIERVYSYGISLGCTSSPRNYCPEAVVTRAQMALFLQRTFNLAGPPT